MRILFSLLLMLAGLHAFSQDSSLGTVTITNQAVAFNGGNYNGYVMELGAEPEVVEDAIKERFKAQGSKSKEIKGFMVFRNVLLPAIDPVKTMDAFFKVEKKSRKEKDETRIYLVASEPGVISDEKNKGGEAAGANRIVTGKAGNDFLNALLPDFRNAVYEKKLEEQQAVIKKEEKKMADLQEDLLDMEKKLKKLENDITFNKKAQEKQVAELERLRQQLEAHKASKPSLSVQGN